MERSQTEAIKLYFEMINGIKDAGGVFYQYRACNLNADTIYDLENINNGVVYARSPLYMNDPFDSMIGFSTEALYQDFVDMLLTTESDTYKKEFIHFLLKEKALGKVAELIQIIKDFQFFLHAQRNRLGMGEPSLSEFAFHQCKKLYPKMTADLKRKIKDVNVFRALALFTADIDLSMVTEQNLLQMLQMDEMIHTLLDVFEETKEKAYIPQFRKFLSGMTVSCFSASGWDNQLMWAHYANSYSGICIEYDFSTVDASIGFVYPVEYTQKRPTITLRDMGFSISEDKKIKQENEKIDTRKIISYLLKKNKCWEYEKEWRIINIGEENTPRFIDMPKIKSITLGLNMHAVSKHLLIDICRDKKIVCYQLVPETGSYELKRELIDLENIEFNMEDELSFVEHLSNHITGIFERVGKINVDGIIDEEKKEVNFGLFITLLSQTNDLLFYIYCLKKTTNSFMRFADESVTVEQFDELKDRSKEIDEITRQTYFDHKDAETGFLYLEQIGKIKSEDCQKAISILKTYSSLQEKVNAVVWDSRITHNKE